MSGWSFIWEEEKLPGEAEATAAHPLGDGDLFDEPKKEPVSLKYIVLIDYENVHTSGLKGISHITEKDEIVIFYSVQQEESIAFLRELRSDIQFAKIEKGGQNALDFQLTSYLGYVIHKAACEEELPRTRFMIISKDNGFNCAIKFWMGSPFVKNLGMEAAVIRAPSIEKAFELSQRSPILWEYTDAEQLKVNEMMEKEVSLSNFYTKLCKKYGIERGRAFYYQNKEQFKELHRV
jgi:hypothetical protein